MELLCPHCMKRVTFPDDKAGQVLNCPLCSGVFAAPSLAPAPVRQPPAPPPPPPAPPQWSEPVPASQVPAQPEPAVHHPAPEPLPPPADYSRERAFRLRPDVLVALPPVCLFLIFVLSFFTWHGLPGLSLNLWQLGFGEHGTGVFIAYVLLTFFVAGPLSAACLVFEHRWVPTPAGLVRLMPWKSLLTFLVLGLTFLLFAYDYQQGLMASPVVDATGLTAGTFGNPIAMAEKLAFRLHLLALVANMLELWVQGRRARHLPLPRFTMQT